ncbi:MAG: hypothetical protein IPI14_01455 [Polaromonas sp.]|nr:hypothetical protein [Polaromonas sp.]
MQNIDRRQALGYIATGAAISTGLVSQTAQAQMQFPMMPFGGNRSGAEFPAVGQKLNMVDVPLLNGKTFTASQAKDQILVILLVGKLVSILCGTKPINGKTMAGQSQQRFANADILNR